MQHLPSWSKLHQLAREMDFWTAIAIGLATLGSLFIGTGSILILTQ